MVGSDNRKWFALGLILAVQFMTILDIAIVNVALSSIQSDLGFSQENLQWVISAYALVFGGFLLLGGRSADLLGRRRVFMFGTFVFTLGSLLCGLAWSEQSLIAFRAFQGLGAATITPAALSILVATFAEGREEDDTLIEQDGVRIVVDPMSAMYLKGSEIDFVDALMGGGFALRNPNAVSSCGCGQSFKTAEQSGTAKACHH